MKVSARCPAKLNLGLRVTGQRDNGYHELDTLFCAVDLFDELEIETREAPGYALRVTDKIGTGLDVPATDDNLVCRALRSLCGEDSGFGLRLIKAIPAGGGLGGGSSDAAQALRCGRATMPEPVSDEQLADLALRLGADVPFLIEGGLQRAVGVGEKLTAEAVAAPLWFVLVVPAFGTSTATVFRQYATTRSTQSASFEDLRAASIHVDGLPFDLGNDLEPPAFVVEPRLERLATDLRRVVPDLALSGSGSTMFCVRTDEASRDRVFDEIRQCLDPQSGVRLIRCGGPIVVDPLEIEDG